MDWSSALFMGTVFYIGLCAPLGKCSILPKCCGEDDHIFKDGNCVRVNNSVKLYTTILHQFEFVVKRPECDAELVLTESIFLNNVTTENLKFTRNGYFNYNHVYYPPDDYCINSISVSKSAVSVSAMICKPICSDSRPCFRKCCAPDEVLEFKMDTRTYCADSGNRYWTPVFYDKVNSTRPPRFLVTKNIILSKRTLFVYPKKNVSEFEMKQSRIYSNGEVELLKFEKTWIKPENEFCIDGGFARASGELNYTFQGFTGNEDDTVIILQAGDLEAAKSKERNIQNAYKTAFFVSSFFLLLNITVYICLRETRKSVYWLTQLSYFVSLFFTYIFLAASYIRSVAERQTVTNDVMSQTCLVIGILAHFFFLSSFCWMTMINVDLWCRLGHHENMFAASSRAKPKKFKKYIWYAAFSIGVPLTIVGGAIVLDNLQCAREGNLITADYGRERCYVKRDAIFPYQYGPIGVLLTVNLIIYVATVISVLSFKNLDANVSFTSTRSTRTIKSRVSENQQSLKLFAKLFLIMGVPWALEVIGWAYGTRIWNWHTIDILNILQSVFIFFIFVCKRDIIRELRRKYRQFDKLLTVLRIGFGEPKITSTRASRPYQGVFAKNPNLSYTSSHGSRSSDFSSTSTRSFALSEITEAPSEGPCDLTKL